jgi:hypothetical protein
LGLLIEFFNASIAGYLIAKDATMIQREAR